MKKKVEEVNQEILMKKSKDNFSNKTFGLVALIVVVVFFLFSYLFNTFSNVFTVKYGGFFIDANSDVLQVKGNSDEIKEIKTVDVDDYETIYKNPLNNYFNKTKTSTIDVMYPEFVNSGLTVVNYFENINTINSDLQRSAGFKHMLFSYGKAYDTYGNAQIDNENYLLIQYPNDVVINLYDIEITNINGTYHIPVDSFLYMKKDKIRALKRDGNKFTLEVIEGLENNTTIAFYNADLERFEYKYYSFVKNLGTDFDYEDKRTIPEEGMEIELPDIEGEIKEGNGEGNNKGQNGNKTGSNIKGIDGKPEYVKPVVKSSKLTTNVYTARGSIEIYDPSGVIDKAPTYTIRANGRTYTRRTITESSSFIIAGLLPNTTYEVEGTYTYYKEDLKTRMLVTFYVGTIKTRPLSDLDSIDLVHQVNNIHSKEVEINNLKITSDRSSETIYGIYKASIYIDGKDYSFSPGEISNIVSGAEINVSTGNSLQSNSTYNYEIRFYDPNGNLLPTTNATGSARTCMLEPTVSMNVDTRAVDFVNVKVKIKNEDNVVLNNFRYEVLDSTGSVSKEGRIEGSIIELRGLDPNKFYTIKAYADIDL